MSYGMKARRVSHRAWSFLFNQLMAAFQAASLQNILSVGRTHTLPEPMHALMPPIMRLIGTLHRWFYPSSKTALIIAQPLPRKQPDSEFCRQVRVRTSALEHALKMLSLRYKKSVPEQEIAPLTLRAAARTLAWPPTDQGSGGGPVGRIEVNSI
jgi:hypothetical protein